MIGALLSAGLVHGGHTLADRDETAYGRLVDTIEQEEGFGALPYDDTLGHATIGYGTLLPITRAQGACMLSTHLQDEETRLRGKWSGYARIPVEAQVAVLDLAYVVGVDGALGFHDMLAALERQDYAAAADEVIDSRFDTEDRHRAERIAAALRGLAN